jgi:hypothetical protein
MTTKAPYIFPERSRAGMIDAIESISSQYYERHSDTFLFSWDVKMHWAAPTTAKELAPYAAAYGPFDPAFDEAWEAELESSPARFSWLIEDMQRHYVDGGYCTYPGNDQGQFEFGFYGRQGGHLCLVSAFGQDMTGDIDDFCDLLRDKEETPFSDLKRLYRALVCMDQDFAPAKVREAYGYAWAFQREQWEEQARDKRVESPKISV